MMKKLIITTVFMIAAFGGADVSAQESKAVFKGTAANSSGMKFSDWDLTLVENKPVTIDKQKIKIMQAHSFNFKAKKGENLFIKTASKTHVSFVIYEDREDGEQIGENAEDAMSWQGVLAKGGAYKIVLSSDVPAVYSITVTIRRK